MTMCLCAYICVCYYTPTDSIYFIIYLWNTDKVDHVLGQKKKKFNILFKTKIFQATFCNHNATKPEINNKKGANNSKHLDIQINLELNRNKIETEQQLGYPIPKPMAFGQGKQWGNWHLKNFFSLEKFLKIHEDEYLILVLFI